MEKHKEKILASYRKRKRMPSITEVMELCDLSSRSSAFYVVNQLVKEGIVEKDEAGSSYRPVNSTSLRSSGTFARVSRRRQKMKSLISSASANI